MKVCTVSEMRAMDRAAIENYGIPDEILMENAGGAVARLIEREKGTAGKRFLIFCGAGNNGGDGLVIARKLHSQGAHVKVFILGPPERFRGPAALNLSIARRLALELEQLHSTAALREDLKGCDGIVDAIFGTGLDRDVEGLYAQTIEEINASEKTVFSVDIPSGVNGDTGRIMASAVHATFTVAFGLPKIGNLLYPGYTLGGRLSVTHISFPPALYEDDVLRIETNDPIALPPRDPSGHKGSFGEVLFIAGASGYYGAPSLAALAFLKAGGGYSRLAAPSSMIPFLANTAREVVFLPQGETETGSISLHNRSAIGEAANGCDLVVIGPGLSLAPETQELVRLLVLDIKKPIVVDGDGLSAISEKVEILREREAPTVLTPHPGEMSRLTGLGIKEIKDDPIKAVLDLSRTAKAIVVLKGARSIVGFPDGRIRINLSGNCGMATAGSGDVLTGAIAAMYGLGLPLDYAAANGVFAHGLAGDLAAGEKGQDGVIARDIMEKLPFALRHMRDGTWRDKGQYSIERLI
jgi:NAD(P)H-hydrate epimerase